MGPRLSWWIAGVLILAGAGWWVRTSLQRGRLATPAPARHEPAEMVPLQAELVSSDSGRERWRLVYAPSGVRTPTELEFTFGPERPSSQGGFTVAPGVLRRQSTESGAELLRAIAAALGAAPPGSDESSVAELTMDVGVLGRNLAMAPATVGGTTFGGSFTDRPSGPWTLTKVFLAGGEGEVFLGLNAKESRALLLPKDPDDASAVVQEFGRLLR